MSVPAKEPRGRGRPSAYRAEYARQAYKLCLLGATDADLARFFEVVDTTISNWKLAHPDFLEALKKGKDEADATVAKSLYRRANGFEHPEEKLFQYEGAVIRAETRKKYPPDTAAAIFWLKNRQKDKWRDKQDLEHTGPGGGPVAVEITRRIVDPAQPA